MVVYSSTKLAYHAGDSNFGTCLWDLAQCDIEVQEAFSKKMKEETNLKAAPAGSAGNSPMNDSHEGLLEPPKGKTNTSYLTPVWHVLDFVGYWFGATRFDKAAQTQIRASQQQGNSQSQRHSMVKKKCLPDVKLKAAIATANKATGGLAAKGADAAHAVTHAAANTGTAITDAAVHTGTAVTGAAAHAEAVAAGQAKRQSQVVMKAISKVNHKLLNLEAQKDSWSTLQRWEVSLLLRVKNHFDRDGDGQISIEEILTSGVEREEAEEELMTQHIPWFILTQVALGVGLWALFAIKNQDFEGVQGLDSLFRTQTDMRVYHDCKDVRAEVWRWFTYQYSHVGISHVMMNSLMNLILGVPLEGFHGFLRMAGIFNIGVLSGSMGIIVSSTHSAVVGMSGGCYSLMGMHAADLLINYSEKRYRRVLIVGLLSLAAVDIGQTFLKTGKDTTSYAAHIGGLFGGLTAGVLFEKNLRVTRCERALQIVTFCAAAAMLVFCFIWLLHWPPRSIWDDTPWCWLRQVSNSTLFGTPRYMCVRCHSSACIQRWENQKHVASVGYRACVKANMWGFKEL